MALALTQTKLPVNVELETSVLWSVVKVVLDMSNQSVSVGVVDNVPCILIEPVQVDST